MIWVKLTPHRHRALLQAVALDETMVDMLTRNIRPRGVKVFDVGAPYAAWRYGAYRLREIAFGPRGGRTLQRTHEFDALREITKAINAIDTHPALKQAGRYGWQGLEIPAWRIMPDNKGRVYTAYPRPGNEFVYLMPEWDKVGNDKVTIWRPGSSDVEAAQESFHLRLWRQAVPA